MAKILALDDVPDAGHLIKRILAGRGHDVSVFTEEKDALAYARSHHVDLAILDIKLKTMSGIEVLKELKTIAPGIRAIMLTGYPTEETERAAFERGADRYCSKPLDTEELEWIVDEVLMLPPRGSGGD
ncbi:MAG: response regulator [Desulfobacteraceae bacterium]|nr:response regulator [Desulfobacteraceae bacterium]